MKQPFRRRPAQALVVVSDVDGTIMHMPAGEPIPYNDGEALLRLQVANQSVVARLLHLEESGFALRFCSGRGEALRSVTVTQLEAAGFRRVADRLFLQDHWLGVAALIRHKRNVLSRADAVLHIGDQPFDLEASVQAGTPFMHVDDFARGEALDHMFCWSCGCTALRACRGGCSWANAKTCTSCARPSSAQLHDFTEVAA